MNKLHFPFCRDCPHYTEIFIMGRLQGFCNLKEAIAKDCNPKYPKNCEIDSEDLDSDDKEDDWLDWN